MAITPGLGTLFQHGITGTYTTIAQRTEITGPSLAMGQAETTHLDSTVKAFRPTIADGGELGLTIEFDPQGATHNLLLGFITTVPPSNSEQWQLQFADASPTKWPFTGFLTKFEPGGMTPEGNLTADISIKLITLPVHSP